MNDILENPVAALSKYVSFPSVSADSNFNEGVGGAREFATARLLELGFSVEIIETPIHLLFWVQRQLFLAKVGHLWSL